jgi:hypothetical protein
MKKLNYLLFVLLLFISGHALGQASIVAGGTYTQDFTSLGTTAAATLPTGWKVDKNTTVRSVGAYSSAVSVTDNSTTYNTAMSTTASNGIYNFGGSSSDDRSLGGLSSSSSSKSVNMYLQLTNSGTSSISSFTINYDAERFRNGSNAAGFSLRLFYSTSGASGSWTELASGIATFGANGDNTGATTNPMETKNISNVALSQTVASGSSIYLAWNYAVTSGTTTSNAQALGIDNISVTAAADIPTGIDTPEAGSVKVYVSGGKLVVSGAVAGSVIRVYTATGSAIKSVVAVGTTETIVVPAGLYLVKVGADSAKVLVK